MLSQQIHRKSSRIVSSLLLLFFAFGVGIKAEPNIISKAAWNGREPTAELTKLSLPVERVIIAHTAGADCTDQDTCAQQVRNLQHFHMTTAHFDDIAYNFLVGNDGNVYEGRGWDNVGAMARGYNVGSVGIAFIGNYERGVPSQAAIDAALALVEMGVNLDKISKEYKLYGHRQLAATTSPGSSLYEAIKKWPNWSRQVV